MAVSKGKKPKKSTFIDLPLMGDAPVDPAKLAIDLGGQDSSSHIKWVPSIPKDQLDVSFHEPDTWAVKALYPAGAGVVGVKLGQPYEHTMTVGTLVQVNKQTFRVAKITTDGFLLAPFNPHAHGIPEHNPLEMPAIKKEWVQEIVSAQNKQGTQHSDIEFMQDMFEDTPVDKELVKHLNLKEESELPNKPSLKHLLEKLGSGELDAPIGKVSKPKSEGVDGFAKMPHIMVTPKPPKMTLGEIAEKAYQPPVNPAPKPEEYADTPKPAELVRLKVTFCPPKANPIAVGLIKSLANCTASLALAAIISKAWIEVDVGLMAIYATDFSEAEDAGVTFAVEDVT